MDYQQFIEYNRTKDQGKYTHKHHVIPKSMGGKNNKENIIRLSWLTHYYAHMLLAKENPENKELQKAYENMGSIDAYLHRCYINMTKNHNLSDEQRKNLSEAMKGNTNSKRPHSYTKRKVEPPKSEEWKRKHSEAMKGRHWTIVDGKRQYSMREKIG